jgi:hypothetical protein
LSLMAIKLPRNTGAFKKMTRSYWFFFSLIMIAGLSYDAFRNFNYTRIELAKAKAYKCECSNEQQQSKQETVVR